MGGTELCRDGKPAALHPEALVELKTSLFSLSLSFLNLIAFYVNECFAYMYACAPCVCQVPTEVSRGHWILWDWSYR